MEKMEMKRESDFVRYLFKWLLLIFTVFAVVSICFNLVTYMREKQYYSRIIEQEQQEETGVAAGDQGTPLRSPGEEVGPHEDAGKDQVEPEDLEPAHKGAGGDRPVPQGIGVFQEPLWEQRPAEAGRRQRQGHACPEQSCRPEQGVGLGDPAPDHIHGSFSPF